jgi:uncharacterized membrane protein (DUF373 family)
MRKLKRLFKKVGHLWNYNQFMNITEGVETIVAKILTIALLIVILVALIDLVVVLGNNLLSSPPFGVYHKTLLETFGLFLNILIALELLDNITAYLRKNIFHVELVIATSLIAIARKIIIFDLKNFSGNELIALAIAILALSISYWLVRKLN